MGTKDFIVPDSFDFRQSRSFRVGQTWGAASYLQIMASELSDKLLLEILELDAELTVTMHIQTVDQVKAIKTVKGKISDIDKMKVEEQRKATRAGYDPDILPPDLVTFSKDAAELLADLQSRNERMFLLTFLIVNTAPTRERLENDIFTVNGIAQKYNCAVKRLDWQQEQGYMSSLALGYNGIEIQRGMTTSSTAIFVPFMTRELRMDGPSLYGFQLEPTTIEGIRTKMMKPDPETADIAKLMFEMYSQPGISFGDIARYFADEGILIYGKEMKRGFISQLLRNPIYAQADLDMYEFFKSQGTVVVNEATDFAGTNGCYLYQGRDVQERKNKHLKDQILVLAPSEGLVSSDTWLRCRKKLMANKTFQGGRKAKNTWLAGKVKCGRCGYALMSVGNPTGVQYLRCSKRADSKSCDGCGTLRTREFERFLYGEMVKKLSEFQTLTAKRETVNPKLTALNMELARVEDEIEKLLNTLTGANAVLLSYANSKIEELDTHRQALTKEIAALSAETMSPEQIERLSVYLNQWEEIDFEDRRQVADGLISQIRATDEHVSIEWKI